MNKDIEEEELHEILEEIGGETMPSLAQRWLEQGIQQGLKQGIQQGIQQGVRDAQEMVLEAINAKFGVCPEHLKEKIMSITDSTRLKELLREILLKDRLEELSLD